MPFSGSNNAHFDYDDNFIEESHNNANNNNNTIHTNNNAYDSEEGKARELAKKIEKFLIANSFQDTEEASETEFRPNRNHNEPIEIKEQ